mgnify:CR=1 FL=1
MSDMGEVLSLYVEEYGLDLREILKKLLLDLWREGEGFSGKRPEGMDSDWQYVLEQALIDAEFAKDRKEADAVMRQAIEALW